MTTLCNPTRLSHSPLPKPFAREEPQGKRIHTVAKGHNPCPPPCKKAWEEGGSYKYKALKKQQIMGDESVAPAKHRHIGHTRSSNKSQPSWILNNNDFGGS